MGSQMIQIIVLAAIALFLVLRLRNVLGTRAGFEKPREVAPPSTTSRKDHGFEVIDGGGPDPDIADSVDPDSDAGKALLEMKRIDEDFSVAEFSHGARQAYEMIVMGFELGNLDQIQPFLAEDVFETFVDVIAAREDQGLKIEAEFVGVREVAIRDVLFDKQTNRAEITMRFVGELTSVVRDRGGDIVEGSPTAVKRQKDTWVFAREMGSNDPNWLLVATDA